MVKLHLLDLDVIFRRGSGKQVSVAGDWEKGKSEPKQQSRRPLRKLLRAPVAGEIPHEQDEECYDGQHEGPEYLAFTGGAANLYLACHIPLDSVSSGNTRALVKLKKTLLKFPAIQNTSGPQGQAALFLPAFVARRDYS